jgi:hypothetical protein
MLSTKMRAKIALDLFTTLVCVSFISARACYEFRTNQFMSWAVVPLKSGKKLMMVDINM